jgi:hypothetical protein
MLSNDLLSSDDALMLVLRTHFFELLELICKLINTVFGILGTFNPKSNV